MGGDFRQRLPPDFRPKRSRFSAGLRELAEVAKKGRNLRLPLDLRRFAERLEFRGFQSGGSLAEVCFAEVWRKSGGSLICASWGDFRHVRMEPFDDPKTLDLLL